MSLGMLKTTFFKFLFVLFWSFCNVFTFYFTFYPFTYKNFTITPINFPSKVSLSGLPRGTVYSWGAKTALPIWCHWPVWTESSIAKWKNIVVVGLHCFLCGFMSFYLSDVLAVEEVELLGSGSWWWNSLYTRALLGPCWKPPHLAVRTCCSL